MLYLLTAHASNGHDQAVKLDAIADELGLTVEMVRRSALELAGDDYVRLMGEGPEAKVILLCDGAQPACPSIDEDQGKKEPLGGRLFFETMESLRIPKNLQPYYQQIYYSLADGLQDFIVPSNRDLIQRVLDHVSAMMDAGQIDERGPTGMIVYMLRRSAQVPRREFSG